MVETVIGSEKMEKESLLELFRRFLRFGLLAWGGPVAQIAMIRQELVEERKWITRERFNRVLGMYQALPGPEAHEICVYFGMTARGRLGGFLAGLGFMLPGFVLMWLLSWFYVTYGLSIPRFGAVFAGLQAAVGALIVRAVLRIGGHALTHPLLWGIGTVAILAQVMETPFLITLVIAGAVFLLFREEQRVLAMLLLGFFALGVVVLAHVNAQSAAPAAAVPLQTELRPGELSALFLSGLRSGLLTFGGAYTVIPFLQHDAVQAQGWLTNAQFLDGLALSGVLPAPLIIFATFVGFLGGGHWGALVMTAGIFLPAFLFTLAAHRPLEALLERRGMQSFLDGITAAVVGFMTFTSFQLLLAAVHDWTTAGLFAAAWGILYFWHARAAVAVVMGAAGLAGAFLL